MKFKKVLKLFTQLMMLSLVIRFPVQAQPIYQWAADQKVPGYLDDTFTPYLLADQNRTVHAFASQWVDDGNDRRLAIVYRKWSLAGGWTRPVDVLLAPTGDATFLGAYLDSAGMMHVVFANGEGRNAVIYYANAPGEIADSVFAWSVPVVIGRGISGVNSAALTGDGRGNLILIYSGSIDGNGVYALHSADSGQTWSDPFQVFLTQNVELVPFSLRLFSGSNGQIRATWNVVTNLGVDESLYFSSYDIVSAKWSKALLLDNRIDLPDYFGPSFPAIVDNGEEIVIIYNGGNPFTGRPVGAGRPVQRSTVSTDGGKTWSNPQNPFPFHLGRSGEHSMVLDGLGRPHTLFVQRIELDVEGEYSIIGGIWHSVFEGASWTNPDRFVTTYSPHDVRSIVVQGNVLLVVWREDPGEGKHGIWFSYSVLDVPELPVIPLPTVNAEFVGGQSDVTTQPSESSFVSATPSKLVDTQPGAPGSEVNPAAPFIVSVAVVIVVLIGVVVIYRVLQIRA